MESDSCIVDSSVFVAFYREVDVLHADALQIMGDLANDTLLVHPYVIQETATVLAYQSGIAVAKRFLTDITDAENVLIPAVDTRFDIARFLANSKRMSFADIALIELSRVTGYRLITFDRQILSSLRRSA